jgi:hypothetical protein
VTARPVGSITLPLTTYGRSDAVVHMKAVLLVIGLTVAIEVLILAYRRTQGGSTATEVFHLRSECASLTEKFGALHPALGSSSWASRYNPKTNRCYALLTEIGSGDIHRELIDVQTGETLASTLRGTSEASKLKAAEIKPDLKLTLPADRSARFEAVERFINATMADDRKR